MDSKVNDFIFCLGDNLNQYYLGTYKVGSSTIESSAEKFFHFIKFESNQYSDSYDDLRALKGEALQAKTILQNNPITIVVRDPYQRLISGLIQEICSFENKKYNGLETLSTNNNIINYLLSEFYFVYLGKNYSEIKPDWNYIQSIVPTLNDLFKKEVFQEELRNWFLQIMGVYNMELLQSNHIRPFYRPLYYFLEDNNIPNYQVKQVRDVIWKQNNTHSNFMFKPPMESALKSINGFDEYLDEETHYYHKLLDE